MSYTDKQLTCSDCGKPFTFGAEEQEFFAQKGYTNEPKRCTECRAAKKQERGGGGGGRGGGFGGSRQMYPAVCATCGKSTEVPFEPRGDRPVYCSACYNASGGGASRSRR
jgi:CxxC-x17-CxxC domain-containing protein